jgi:hypothetical protein
VAAFNFHAARRVGRAASCRLHTTPRHAGRYRVPPHLPPQTAPAAPSRRQDRTRCYHRTLRWRRGRGGGTHREFLQQPLILLKHRVGGRVAAGRRGHGGKAAIRTTDIAEDPARRVQRSLLHGTGRGCRHCSLCRRSGDRPRAFRDCCCPSPPAAEKTAPRNVRNPWSRWGPLRVHNLALTLPQYHSYHRTEWSRGHSHTAADTAEAARYRDDIICCRGSVAFSSAPLCGFLPRRGAA